MIVGIDLGTTNSLVAAWRDGRPELIPNALGQVLTPSCVSLDADGSVLVGQAARDRLQTHPERSAAVFKRYMGSQKLLRLGPREFRPEELSALVLKSLKADAEAALGQPVTDAVITVPAYFSDAQRKATKVAGQLAGLQVDRLLNEPTAAALAYGLGQRDSDSRVLVFDLGGGTFDVSVLELFEGVMEVRASAGDNYLGGEDFVLALCEHFCARLALPEATRNDPVFNQRLQAQAERAKRQLGLQPQATLRVTHQGTEHRLEVDQAGAEQLWAPLLKRLRAPVERALRDARLRSSALDQIVLAGGATRMPAVRRLVTTLFGRFPAADLNPDEVVALGAAVQAGLMARDAALSEVVLTDVCPYSLGIEVSVRVDERSSSTGHFDPLIERNTPVPVSRAKRYVAQNAQQRQAILQVYQGEARMVRDNVHLGSLTVPLPAPMPGAPTQPRDVEVRFTYDVNGLLQVEALVLETGQTVSLVLQGHPGLMTEDEIARRLTELSTLKIHPRDQLENRSLLARAERLYVLCQGTEREWLAAHILQFETLLAGQDVRSIGAGRRELATILDQFEQRTMLD